MAVGSKAVRFITCPVTGGCIKPPRFKGPFKSPWRTNEAGTNELLMDLFLVYFHLLSTKVAACSTHSSCSLCSLRFAHITRHWSLEKTHGSTSWWKLPVRSGHCEVWSLLFGARAAEMSQKRQQILWCWFPVSLFFFSPHPGKLSVLLQSQNFT